MRWRLRHLQLGKVQRSQFISRPCKFINSYTRAAYWTTEWWPRYVLFDCLFKLNLTWPRVGDDIYPVHMSNYRGRQAGSSWSSFLPHNQLFDVTIALFNHDIENLIMIRKLAPRSRNEASEIVHVDTGHSGQGNSVTNPCVTGVTLSQAFHYFENISHLVIHAPSSYSLTLVSQLSNMVDRLKYHDSRAQAGTLRESDLQWTVALSSIYQKMMVSHKIKFLLYSDSGIDLFYCAFDPAVSVAVNDITIGAGGLRSIPGSVNSNTVFEPWALLQSLHVAV